MRTFKTSNARTAIAALALGMTAVACDNPVTPEEHPEAGGVVILEAGTSTVLARSVGALAVFDQAIELAVGESLEVEVLFLDASAPLNLALAFHAHEDDGESLRVTVTNPAVVEYHAHGDHGDFEAVAAGETTVQFDLMHGSHKDFSSGNLTIVVE